MPNEKARADGKVSYRRPPRHTQFQPGRSGNPFGRPKGSRNLATDVRRTLATPVKLSEQGRSRRVSTQEAALLRLREKALSGDMRSLDLLLDLARTYNGVEAGPGGEAPMSSEDEAILAAYREEVRADARSVATQTEAVKEDVKDEGSNDD